MLNLLYFTFSIIKGWIRKLFEERASWEIHVFMKATLFKAYSWDMFNVSILHLMGIFALMALKFDMNLSKIKGTCAYGVFTLIKN